MSVDDLLLAGGFAASTAGLLVAVLSVRQGRKWLIILALAAFGSGTLGIALYRAHQHDRAIADVSSEVLVLLKSSALTFDELHEHLLFRSFPEANEALFALIRRGAVRHCLLRTDIDGALVSARVYFLQDPSPGSTVARPNGCR